MTCAIHLRPGCCARPQSGLGAEGARPRQHQDDDEPLRACVERRRAAGQGRGADGGRCIAFCAKVARFVARSPQTQTGRIGYVIEIAWLPILDTYRTMCIAPDANFRRVLRRSVGRNSQLSTQQRCPRMAGQISPAAFHKPRAPSAIASSGRTSRPRRFRSSSSSRQSCALSRAPSVKPTSSLRPSGVAPISTRMHCFSSSSRACR